MRALFFDLDNTLIDRNAAQKACLAAFFVSYLPSYVFEHEAASIMKKDNWGYTSREVFCQWFVERYQPQGWDAARFWQYLKTTIADYVPPLLPSTEALLHKMAATHQLGILSNGSVENQQRKIRQVGLERFISPQHIYISGAYPWEKPDHRCFEVVTQALQLAPEAMTYVGDHPTADIVGGQNAGWHTVWLRQGRVWPLHRCMPHVQIENLASIEPKHIK